MSRTYTTLSRESINYLCSVIKHTASLSDNIVDDLHLRSDGTFSSVKINTLLNTLKTDCNQYTDTLVANLARLELKLVTDESDISQPNIMYLYKPAGATSYNQYVVIDGTKVLLGTCDVEMSDYLKVSDAANKYTLKTDYDTLVNEVTDIKDKINTHTDDTDIHTSADEKASYALKADITDTIDSTSTSDKMASAKAVYDKIKGIIYSNEDLDLIPEPGLYMCVGGDTYGSTHHFPVPDNGYLFHICYPADGYKAQIFIPNGVWGGDLNQYIRRQKSGTWSGWRRMCSTTVADVPKTRIEPPDTTKFAQWDHAYYTVLNGICYVSVWGVVTTETTSDIDTGIVLPTPLFDGAGTFLTGLGTSTPSGYIFVTQASHLSIDKPIPNSYLYGSFSYPVAES